MKLLRPKEVKAKYAISATTLLEYERAGLISPKKTAGGHRRYLESDIEALLVSETLKEYEEQPKPDPALQVQYGVIQQMQQSDKFAEFAGNQVALFIKENQNKIRKLKSKLVITFNFSSM